MLTSSFELVQRIRQTYPASTASEISRILGISRERVRQLLSKAKLLTNFRLPNSLCLVCAGEIPAYQKYCSRICQYSVHRITIKCAHCEKDFTISKSSYRIRREQNKNLYCSNWCRLHVFRGNVAKPLDWKDLDRRRLVNIGSSKGFVIGNKLLRELDWERDRDTFAIKKIDGYVVIIKNEY